MLRNFLLAVVMLAAAVSFCGCVEQKQEYTINPDGSGKARINIAITIPEYMTEDEDNEYLQEYAKETVKEILLESKGIDAWRQVEYRVNDQKKIEFKGTFYFKDLNEAKLELSNEGICHKAKVVKNDSGEITVLIINDSREDNNDEDSSVILTEEEIQKKITKSLSSFKRLKEDADEMFSGLKDEYIFHLPGKIIKSSNFEKISKDTVRLVFTEKSMMNFVRELDKRIADKKWVREMVKSDWAIIMKGADSEDFNEIVFGEKAPVVATTSNKTKALFDYDKEVRAAKAKYAEMLEKIDISPKILQEIPPGEKLEYSQLIVGGVRIVNYEEDEYGVRPFNWDKEYMISGILALPENVVGISYGEVETAKTDNEQDLLAEPQEIDGDLSQDKKFANIEVKLNNPDTKAKGIKELKGFLKCISANGTKEIDLGTIEFKSNTKSNKAGFGIRKIDKSEWEEDAYVVYLYVDFLPHELKETIFFDENGKKLGAFENEGDFSSGRLLGIGFTFDKKLPEKGKIVFVVHDKLKEHKMEFGISNVDFLGRPLE